MVARWNHYINYRWHTHCLSYLVGNKMERQIDDQKTPSLLVPDLGLCSIIRGYN
ncbi:TPA: hypothetical protein KRN68_003891 [Clostridioides difficile]|nr:hypothetical protein [Clostridioides difficile]